MGDFCIESVYIKEEPVEESVKGDFPDLEFCDVKPELEPWEDLQRENELDPEGEIGGIRKEGTEDEGDNARYLQEDIPGSSNSGLEGQRERNISFCSSRKNETDLTGEYDDLNFTFVDICKTETRHTLPTNEFPFKCIDCGHGFKTETNLVDHCKNRSGENCISVRTFNSFQCEHCGVCFRAKSAYTKHLETHASTTKIFFQCIHCDKCFTQRNDLVRHEMIHKVEKPHAFNYCNEPFTHRSNLINREKIRTVKKPFKCDHCEMVFRRRRYLRKHQLVHTKEKNLECGYCGKKFARRRSLVYHERSHTGDMPYECKFCEKSFPRSTSLINHETTHTGEYRFTCKFCGKGINSKTHLDNHERTHTKEKPFPCSYCNRSFPRKCSKLRHERTHTGEKPYACDSCGKRYACKTGLRHHITALCNPEKIEQS